MSVRPNCLIAFVAGFLFFLATPPGLTDPIRIPSPADDFFIDEVMIPMRDGIELYTVIVRPKHPDSEWPIMLMRTPYGAASQIRNLNRTNGAAIIGERYAELSEYIWVFQDIRGRYGSQGEYITFRPFQGQFNNKDTDETTDAWDTVEWLVNNVEKNNSRVGLFGTSYAGWLVLAGLLGPHPAVKAAVPVGSMVDLWMGDDAFHNGAFRLGYMVEYSYRMEVQPDKQYLLPHDKYDLFEWWLNQGSLRQFMATYLPDAPLFNRIINQPAYDEFWQDIAIQRRFDSNNSPRVPVLNVHGWFDQEDAFGAPAIYEVLEKGDKDNTLNFFTAGPWYHGENWASTNSLGSLQWGESTGQRWRRDVLAPFLDHYLKGKVPHRLSNAVVFNTGINRWESFDEWPAVSGTEKAKLFLWERQSLTWQDVTQDMHGSESYLSDPNSPIPYQPRPIRAKYADDPQRGEWRKWQVVDQRFVDSRPDVLTFATEPLDSPLTIRGTPTAHIFAATTGSDADWIVKVIDVFPDQDAFRPEMSGYQLMISGEIFRGRYRESFSNPAPIVPNQPSKYSFNLPPVNHTFQAGHRIMVQIQSSWFPIYDRNPQKWVPNIMDASPDDYQEATHSVFFGGDLASHIELRLDAR